MPNKWRLILNLSSQYNHIANYHIAIRTAVCPLIFSVLADALTWTMQKHGVSWVEPYIDRFITVGTLGGLRIH